MRCDLNDFLSAGWIDQADLEPVIMCRRIAKYVPYTNDPSDVPELVRGDAETLRH